MIYSAQQTAVFDWARKGKGSLNLVARAGCGKTSTLLELVNQLVADNKATRWFSVFLGAYNKAIASEIKAKLAKAGIEWNRATAGTMHSAGFNAWRKVAPDVKVDGNKIDGLIGELIDTFKNEGAHDDAQNLEDHRSFVVKLISLAKQRAFGFLVSVTDKQHWYNLVDHFGLDDELEEDQILNLDMLVDFAIMLYTTSLSVDRDVIDYDDMILAPLVHNVRMWQYDWVLIDEAQDTNAARRALALKMMKPKTGRLVAVGDPAQAIYGFTGADSESMYAIKTHLNSIELKLNCTYRCPHAVVKLAQTWVPDIRATPEAPQGQHYTIDLDQLLKENLTKRDVVLCRNTKPLVELAYSLLRQGVACRIEGRDIAAGLITLIRRWKVANISTLLDKLPEYKDKQIQKWLAKGLEAKAAQAEDLIETVIVLGETALYFGHTAVSSLIKFINDMFGDTPEGQQPDVLTLCTVHKSKGREWPRVYILGRNRYMPSRYARKDWQMEQEQNLMYVAVTRSQDKLIDIHVEEPSKDV